MDQITRQGVNPSNLDEYKKLLKSGLEEIAKGIDKKLEEYGEKRVEYGEEGIEYGYVNLELEYLYNALFEKDKHDIDDKEDHKFLWLGSRTHIIDDIAKKVEGKEINEELIKDILEEYKKEKIRFLENKKREFDKAEFLCHGSKNLIQEFKPKIGSAGDLKPLVYFSADESFAVCFAMFNSYLAKKIRNDEVTNKKIVFFQGHSLENLIIDHDVGGHMHYVTGDEKKKFGVGYAKNTAEFCSTQDITPTRSREIPSALNEIILKNEDIVEIKQGEVVDSKKLIETRQRIINVLSKNENDLNEKEREYLNSLDINEKYETKQELLERLQKQQENVKEIAPHIAKLYIKELDKENIIPPR